MVNERMSESERGFVPPASIEEQKAIQKQRIDGLEAKKAESDEKDPSEWIRRSEEGEAAMDESQQKESANRQKEFYAPIVSPKKVKGARAASKERSEKQEKQEKDGILVAKIKIELGSRTGLGEGEDVEKVKESLDRTQELVNTIADNETRRGLQYELDLRRVMKGAGEPTAESQRRFDEEDYADHVAASPPGKAKSRE